MAATGIFEKDGGKYDQSSEKKNVVAVVPYESVQPTSDRPEPETEYDITTDPGIYYSLRPTIIFAMCFAVMPLRNPMVRCSSQLKFSFCSVQSVYSITILISLSFIASLSVAYFFVDPAGSGAQFGSVAIRLMGPLFYTSACVSMALTLNVTRNLPGLLREWDLVANRLVHYTTASPNGKHVVRHHRQTVLSSTAVTCAFMFSAILEHTLHDINFFSQQNCDGGANGTIVLGFVDCYLDRANNFVSGVLGKGHSPIVVAAYFLNKYANFAWNFHDLLLIQLSLALRVNFKVIADHLAATRGITRNPIQWRQMRRDHLDLCRVVALLDSAVAPMVLLSYSVSVYFLAHQIFMGIRPTTGSLLEASYILAAFFHLIARIVFVSFSASSFYDQVLEPMPYLHECSSVAYSPEVHRFIQQIAFSDVGFTGCKFFVINRSFFLAIISVIVTYELLLLDVK